MRTLLALAILAGSGTARADAQLAELQLDGPVQLAAAGNTLVVAVDTSDQPRLRYFDFAKHAQTGTGAALGRDRAITLIDGRSLFATEDNAPGVYALDGKRQVTRPEKLFRSSVRGIAVNGGTYAVAGTHDDTVYAFDAKGLHAIELAKQDPEVGMATTVAFSGDGKRLAIGTSGHFAFEVDTATWKVARQLYRADAAITALAYAKAQLLVGTRELLVFDTATGKRLDVPAKRPEMEVDAIAVSPDGAYIAVGGHEYKIRIYAAGSWKQKAILEGHTNDVSTFAWSGDGKYLASGTQSGELRLWAPLE